MRDDGIAPDEFQTIQRRLKIQRQVDDAQASTFLGWGLSAQGSCARRGWTWLQAQSIWAANDGLEGKQERLQVADAIIVEDAQQTDGRVGSQFANETADE